MSPFERKVHTLDIVPLHSESPPQKRSGMARVLKGFHSFTCSPTHVHPQSEWAIPAFAFPAITGTHLPTPEGWKAEYTLVHSSPGRDSNLQPPNCKSGTLPHSHWCTTYTHTRPINGCSATLIKWHHPGIYALDQLTGQASVLTRENGHAYSEQRVQLSCATTTSTNLLLSAFVQPADFSGDYSRLGRNPGRSFKEPFRWPEHWCQHMCRPDDPVAQPSVEALENSRGYRFNSLFAGIPGLASCPLK